MLTPRVLVLLCLTFALVASQLPLSLLRAIKGSPVLVELKSGEMYIGQLVSTDAYMNLTVSEVICTAPSWVRLWKLRSHKFDELRYYYSSRIVSAFGPS